MWVTKDHVPKNTVNTTIGKMRRYHLKATRKAKIKREKITAIFKQRETQPRLRRPIAPIFLIKTPTMDHLAPPKLRN